MPKPTLTPQQLFSFYREAEKLKTIVRHSWLSNPERQESVAEHTWMMSLLAMVILPHIKQPLNQEKILRMIVVHDLAEAVTEDMPIWEGVKNKSSKHVAEKSAITQMLSHLDTATADQLLAVWEEYEARETLEAKFVKVIDTLDVVVQHNVAPISTWNDNDYLWQLSPLQNDFFNFDEFMRTIKNELDTWSIQKAEEAGNLEKLDQAELKKRQK